MISKPDHCERRTRTQIALGVLQAKLRETTPSGHLEISEAESLEAILPADERRAIWKELQSAGFRLPELRRSSRVTWMGILMVVAPLALLALAFETWSVWVAIVELSFVAYRLTRPLAIYPPDTCKTVGQAAMCLKNIRAHDGTQIPWTRDEISLRVRMILSEYSGVPLAKIGENSSFDDLGLS